MHECPPWRRQRNGCSRFATLTALARSRLHILGQDQATSRPRPHTCVTTSPTGNFRPAAGFPAMLPELRNRLVHFPRRSQTLIRSSSPTGNFGPAVGCLAGHGLEFCPSGQTELFDQCIFSIRFASPHTRPALIFLQFQYYLFQFHFICSSSSSLASCPSLLPLLTRCARFPHTRGPQAGRLLGWLARHPFPASLQPPTSDFLRALAPYVGSKYFAPLLHHCGNRRGRGGV
jgi:hypothetical protein